ncbi:sugar transferase [Chryseobacterium sp. POL2]|uniref:sugar transferase n=1 Tax=Chryseobacterium sp. POL2 TaxID=2713414 RepID=UPI0013E11689|nr:sugar transferase [Chryseobacterium sp. POL2]QIG89174.1 sugar transferase [Chryseobacterium sp. POL2]
MKRFFDIVLSLIGIIVLIPVYIIIAIAISLDSKGGVIYRQKRIGRNSVPFDVLKFRTMRPDSFSKGALTVGDRDPRVTKVGYFLRKYKLDELPQLFNVLLGDMSFVGPRPEVEKYTKLYNEEQKKVLSVRPGITDNASIKYRNESELLAKSQNPEQTYIDVIMPEKLTINLDYIEDNNVFKDIKIIFDTFSAIVKD